MGERRLTFHTSNRLDILAERLAEVMRAAPLPPACNEIVVVQSQGMRRWLALALATHHGVCAGTAMPFPQTFVHALGAALGDESAPESHDESAFGRNALTWSLFSALAEIAKLAGPAPAGIAEAAPGSTDGPEVLAPAARYLTDDGDGRKRYQLARRLADLFDNYQLFRPEMLLAWQRDPAALPAGLEEHRDTAAWQARLWRHLVASAGEPSLAARLTTLIGKLESEDPSRLRAEIADALPPRVSVFGVSTLPPVFIRLLTALSRTIPVTLYFVSPTREYWADIRSGREAERIREHVAAGGGEEEDAHVEEGNALLASLGTQGREFFSLLQHADADGTAWQPLAFREPGVAGALQAVQSDILDLRSEQREEDGGDDSIVVDCCHSPMREMEVLRDRILDAFERDADLRPDDILVMVSDIARYAPYIDSVFGVHEPGIPKIPYSIADRAPVEEASAIKAVLRLLEVATGRFEAGEVVDLLELEVVRRKFDIGAEALPLLRTWTGMTNIRWGIDAGWRRRELGVEHMEANSWKSGIDRMLMGYAVGDCDTLVGGIAPAAAAAADADLLGRFAAFTETLFSEQRALRTPATAAAWAATVRRICDLFLEPEPDDEPVLATLRAALDQLSVHARRARLDEKLYPAVLRAWLRDTLADDSKGRGFIDGRITFCALKPMRTIPFRMICVAGLGDREFPRRDRPAGFDLMAAAPRPGDRSLRGDDRYLFLETVLAAERRLVLTYEGRSQTDTAERAPSVVLSELLDYLDRAFARDEDGRGAGERAVVVQAMHPFDSRYFDGADARLFSYSQEYRAVAAASGDARLRARCPALVALETPVEVGDELDLTPYDLAELWVNPSKEFVRAALGFDLHEGSDDDADAEPFELDNLERYGLQQSMLGRRVQRIRSPVADDGQPSERELTEGELSWLRACGELPVGGFGAAVHADLAETVDELAARIGDPGPTTEAIVDLRGPGWRVAGTLEGAGAGGLIRYRCATLKPADTVRAWVRHVILNVAVEEGQLRDAGRRLILHASDASVVMEPLAQPRRLLDELVAGYREGMSRPLPLFPYTAFTYADELRKRRAGAGGASVPDATLRRAWEGNAYEPGADRSDRYVALCFRDIDPIETFGQELRRLAERLWLPIFESCAFRKG